MRLPERLLIPICVLVSVLSWASAYPFVRLALRDLSPLSVAALRYALAACMALIWLIVKRPVCPSWADVPRLFLCGLFGITLYNIFFNLGETTLSSGATSLVIASSPLLAALIAVCLTNERLSVWGWLGSMWSFMGVVIIVLGQKQHIALSGGALLAFFAAICSAVYTVLQRPLVQRYGGLTVTSYVLIIGAVCLFPWLVQGGMALRTAPLRAWWCIVELGVFPAAIGYAVWSYVVGVMGAARGAMMLYFLPPVTFILAFLLEGSWPDYGTLTGGAVVMSGVMMSRMKGIPGCRSVRR